LNSKERKSQEPVVEEKAKETPKPKVEVFSEPLGRRLKPTSLEPPSDEDEEVDILGD